VKDCWGANLPVMRGQNNFDVVRYEYYRDRDVAFEGFTAKNYLFREEFTSRVWATRYDFPAMRDGRVKRDILPDETPSGGQGWFINTRRDKFKDRRVRAALIHAFDFEWTNKSIMHVLYERTHSVFQNSDMMAKGKPGADELKLLEPFRGKVLDEVFGECFVPAASDGSGRDRALLRSASQLLQDAGLAVKDGKRAREPIDVNETALEALRSLRAELDGHGVKVRLELATGLPPVMGHRGQLREVFLNLVHNALDAMNDMADSARLLQVITQRHGPDAIVVAVKDTGPGIDPKRLNGVFDPFVTTKSHGMGLGLSICRTIIEHHGGQLTAYSDGKNGALFQFVLPSKRMEEAATRLEEDR
jgi:hypothetical protein